MKMLNHKNPFLYLIYFIKLKYFFATCVRPENIKTTTI